MSLRIWLPLENDLTNNGATSVSVTNNGATVVTDGKIGNCYRFNKNAYISIDKEAASTITSGEASFCLFLKVNSFNAAWDTYVQLGLGTTPWVAYTMGLLRDNTGSNLVFVISNGSSATNNTYKTPNITTGVWYHIACVYKPGHCLIYINGKLYADNATTIVPNFSGITAISLGGLSSTYKTDSFISDFRIYDHALSDTEVKEISDMHNELSLICHIPLDKIDSGSTVYDISGYGNNGTLSANKPTITSGAPGKYSSSMLFNGTNNFIMLGRGPMVRDELTVNVWAYMDDWSTYAGCIASCTEGGGWEFEPGSGKMEFLVGTGTSTNTYQSVLSSQALADLSGWVMFTGTYDGYNVKIYINGALSNINVAYTTKTPIYYHTANGIFIGCEAQGNTTSPGGYYFNGRISDFRIYASALSEEEIFELYNTTNHPDLDFTVFTDTDSFTDTSDLYVKEIHILELQNALNKLDTYTNVDNCGYVNCCESCQDACICQSDACQSCQNTCTCQSDKCQSCQNKCNQCTDKCQSCQNKCKQCTDKCQKCQNTCNQCTDKCQSCQTWRKH